MVYVTALLPYLLLLIILSIGSCLISGGICYCLIAIPPVVDNSEYWFMFDFRLYMLLPYCHTTVVDYSEYWFVFDFRWYMLLPYCHTSDVDYSEYWFLSDFRLYMLLPYCHTSVVDYS